MVNPAQAQAARAGTAHDAFALSLAQSLAQELAAGRVELPGIPEVATHVQRVLADEDVTPLRVVRAVGAEPVLAGRIIQCANSVIFNPGGRPVLELRTAVARVGLDFMRTLTISFAVHQMKAARSLRVVQPQLNTLWLRSVTVSTLGFVIARRLVRINADTALLAGLLHAVGALYILTRSVAHPELRATAAYAAIAREWESSLARALLESWRIPDAIIEAIGSLHRAERDAPGAVGLPEILRAAVILERVQRESQDLAAAMAASPSCVRLGLTPELYESLIQESEAEIAALRGVLGC